MTHAGRSTQPSDTTTLARKPSDARVRVYRGSVVKRSSVAVALSAACIFGAAGPAHADENHSWTSLYASGPYAGAGWAACAEPIRVSVDSRAVSEDARTKIRNSVKAAVGQWNANKVVKFAFAGELPVHFDYNTGVSTAQDNQPRDRWIYLTVVKNGDGTKVDPNVVGLAGPLRIDPATNTIVEASAAFRAKYLNKASKAQAIELLAHELGHVFGLGHSTSKADTMYATLTGHTALGSGDLAGIKAVTKPCPAGS